MPTPLDELIFSDDEHDNRGTNDIEDNVLGDTFDEEHSKEVELEESLPESRRAPSVLDVETEGETHSSNEENKDEELCKRCAQPQPPNSWDQEPPINCVVVATMLGLKQQALKTYLPKIYFHLDWMSI